MSRSRMLGSSTIRTLALVLTLILSGPRILLAQGGNLEAESPALGSQGGPPQAGLFPEGPEELFQQGNRLYQEGDFSGALDVYRAVLDAGFHSPDLYYNLGNVFFKTGDLGRSILNYERAAQLRPGDADIEANLELARSLTVDEIEPLPRFWVLSVLSWWVNLLPRAGLVSLLVLTYLLGTGGLCVLVLSRRPGLGRVGGWLATGGALGILFFGATFLAREKVLGGTDWGIVLSEAVPVQSAPSDEANLTLFLVHEGTKVRIDQTSETWLEVVLEDGKVGWVPVDVLEII